MTLDDKLLEFDEGAHDDRCSINMYWYKKIRQRMLETDARIAKLREALEYYARSPNDNRTRAETVPMIDYLDDTAVARAALKDDGE